MKVNVPEINLPRVLIIGGGFGGLMLAEKLRKAPVQVVMFDKRNYHTFQPLLYQVATGGLEPDSIAFPLRKNFKRFKNFHFRVAEVEKVIPEERIVQSSIGEIGYDFLVIATGSKTNFFGNTTLEEKAVGMKSVPEALDLRSLILQNFENALVTTDIAEQEALMNFVVVGAGPSGVETAGALAELRKHVLPTDYPELDLRKMQIHVIEAADRVLPVMHKSSSLNAHHVLIKFGVNVWLNTRVTSYDGKKVRTDGKKVLPANTVIWTAGVVGNTMEGLENVLVRGNRIKVDEYNRVEGLDRVFAIGDVAAMLSEEFPDGHPMVAPPAMQQGALLGKNILNIIKEKPLMPFVYKDLGSMATIGRNKAVVEFGGMRIKGRIAWLIWMLVHIMQIAGFRNKLVTFINWIWSYFTYDKGTRLIIRPFTRKSPIATKRLDALEPDDPKDVLFPDKTLPN